MKTFGIDISRWQGDFNMVKAKAEGVEFVIVKGGGGDGDSGLYVDRKFTENYQNAKKLGLPVGCYWFSKALSISDAKKEAEYFISSCLKGRQFELPVYMDVEQKDMLALGKRALTDVIKAFLDTLVSKGYYAGIYSSKSMFGSYMYDSELSSYPHWVAQWATACTYTGKYGMWQFGGETNKLRANTIAGVVCDQDYMLEDYPSIIKAAGKNGFVKSTGVKKTGTVKELIALAESEVGYLEKASNSQLDSKTANAGSKNYTKYARDMDAITGFYNGKKQGYAWCDVFVDWLFVQVFGVEEAKRLLCQPDKSLGAGVNFSLNYYKAKGRLYSQPKVGDQVFFGTAHTGFVKKVSGNTFWTIEGNTSSSSGVIANGGGVFEKRYTVTSNYKFGRPDYTNAEMEGITTATTTTTTEKTVAVKVRQLSKGMDGNDVRTLQAALIANGYSCGSAGADGDFGSGTDAALRKFQAKYGLGADGIAGSKTWNKLLSK